MKYCLIVIAKGLWKGGISSIWDTHIWILHLNCLVARKYCTTGTKWASHIRTHIKQTLERMNWQHLESLIHTISVRAMHFILLVILYHLGPWSTACFDIVYYYSMLFSLRQWMCICACNTHYSITVCMILSCTNKHLDFYHTFNLVLLNPKSTILLLLKALRVLMS